MEELRREVRMLRVCVLACSIALYMRIDMLHGHKIIELRTQQSLH